MRLSRRVALVVSALVIVGLVPGLLPASQRAVAAQELPTIPAPVAVTLDPATTAYLVLDITSANCPTRPSCVASVPPIAALLARARQANVFVVYSSITQPGAEILPEVAPLASDPVVVTSADKFYNTQLDELLQSRSIRTVILVGSSATGAVMYTAFGASQRGYTSVVPEDGLSAPLDFQIFMARFQMLNQPGGANPDNEPLR